MDTTPTVSAPTPVSQTIQVNTQAAPNPSLFDRLFFHGTMLPAVGLGGTGLFIVLVAQMVKPSWPTAAQYAEYSGFALIGTGLHYFTRGGNENENSMIANQGNNHYVRIGDMV